MSKIDDIRLKIQRANAHLEEFKDTVRGKRGTVYPPHAVGIQFQPQWKHIIVESERIKPRQKLEWGIIIGDVVHQLRTVLDHVIYGLATRTQMPTERELRQLNFPICKDANDFGTLEIVRTGFLEKMIGAKEFAEVVKSQPYERRPTDALNDEMWVLKRLDDVNKHRTVFVLDNRVLIQGTAVSADNTHSHKFRFIKEPLKPETEAFDIGWPHDVPPMGVSMDSAVRFVVFNDTDPLCDGRETIPLLRMIVDSVDDTATNFDQFFPF
jgi:hypothetical protein